MSIVNAKRGFDKSIFNCYYRAMFLAINKFFQYLINIIYPRRCLTCKNSLKNGSIDQIICIDCWARIKKNPLPNCYLKGTEDGLHFNRAYAFCKYEGVLKELIHKFKYSQKEYLGPSLSRLLIESTNNYGLGLDEFDFVVPVPLHKRKLREREFNQAHILAKNFAENFGLNIVEHGLLRISDSISQTELPKEKRISNVKDCFLANPKIDLKGKNILLVDDLLTTGATCSEAAGALKKAGCAKVWAIALAN